MRKVIFKTEHLIPPIMPASRIEKKIDLNRERDALRGSYARECECDGYNRLGKLNRTRSWRSVRVV